MAQGLRNGGTDRARRALESCIVRLRRGETISQALADLPDEDATKVLRDCIKRVKSKYLSSKSNELVKGLRGQGEAVPSDQLEQIMNIQKDRRSL
mgnify:CR=1 FL=1